jgi:lipopolysaccharide/colanic/teichoic acid biosynthesis glycosyltransferase
MLAIAIAIASSCGRPVLYRQIRLGRDLRPFLIHKFRTLEVGSDEDDTVAPEGDPRVTQVGRFLRHYRLDELPQLYDVLRGRMAAVGPRPETPANLSAVDEELLERWLSVRPGITGPTQLAFIAEDEVLRDDPNPTKTYRDVLVPAKVRHGIEWLSERSTAGDLLALATTLVVLATRRGRLRSRELVESLLDRPTHSSGA